MSDTATQTSEPTGQSVTPEVTPTEPTVFESAGLSRFKGEDGKVNYENLGKSYLELDSMLGNRVEVPNDKSTPEAWEKFYNRLRPSTAGEYDINLQGVPDIDEGKLSQFKQSFYEAGMSQTQVTKVMNTLMQQVVEEDRASKQADLTTRTEVEVALKTKWGPNYEGNKGTIQSMLREMGGEQGDVLNETLTELMEGSETVANFLLEAAQVMRTSPLLKGESQANFGLMSHSEALAEKNLILHDPEHHLYKAYHNKLNYSIRKPAIDRLKELNTILAQG